MTESAADKLGRVDPQGKLIGETARDRDRRALACTGAVSVAGLSIASGEEDLRI